MDPNAQPVQPVNPDPNQPQPPAGPAPLQDGVSAPEPAAPAIPPQVPFTPASPVPPMGGGGFPMQPGAVTPPPVAPKNNKKLIILIASIVGGLIVLAVAGVILISLFTVSKKDYNDALAQYDAVSSANSTLNSKVSSLQYDVDTTTDTSFNNDLDAANAAVTQVRSENEKLSKLKAVNIGEGATKYKMFSTKLDTYLTYTSNLLKSFKNMRTAAKTCNDADGGSTISAIKAGIDTCVTALDGVGELPDGDVKSFVSTLKSEYTKLSGIMTSLAGISDPYGKQYDQYKSLRDQMYDVIDNITNAQTDFKSNLEKHVDEADPKSAADELSKYLESKIAN